MQRLPSGFSVLLSEILFAFNQQLNDMHLTANIPPINGNRADIDMHNFNGHLTLSLSLSSPCASSYHLLCGVQSTKCAYNESS